MNVGMLRGAGDSLTWKQKGFLASWFLGFWFLVHWDLASGRLVYWFLGFKNLLCSRRIFVTYYQTFISCLQINIGPISNISKVLLDGPSRFVSVHLSKTVKQIRLQHFEIYENPILKMIPGFSWFFRYHGVSKDRNKWFWCSGTRPKHMKSQKWGVLVSPISKSKSYKFKLKQHNSPELISLLFP